jgi:hypothetical protein
MAVRMLGTNDTASEWFGVVVSLAAALVFFTLVSFWWMTDFRADRSSATPWAAVEILALTTALFISTRNYMNSLGASKQIESETQSTALRIDAGFAFLNLLLFVFAGLVLRFNAILQLTAIALIYASFAVNNWKIAGLCVKMLGDQQTKPHRRVLAKRRLIEMQSICDEENAPSVLAYAFAMTIVAFLSMIHVKDPSWVNLESLKAFSGGAAAFHLVVSTVHYKREMAKDNALTCFLNGKRWSTEIENWVKDVEKTGPRIFPSKFSRMLFFALVIATIAFAIYNGETGSAVRAMNHTS